MSNRWMAFMLFGLGMVTGPMAFHLGDSLLKPAVAEDAPLLVTESPWVKGDINVKPVKSSPSQDVTWEGYTLSFERNGAATLQRHVIQSGENTASDSKVNFTDSVKILDGAFNFNVISPTFNTPGTLSVPGTSPIVVQSGCCPQFIGDLAEYRPITAGRIIRANDACEGDVAVNLVGVSSVITTGGTITFDGGTGYGIVLTANTIQNAERLPNTEEDMPNLTAKFIQLSQELAKRKLQRLSPLELVQKIEELEQEIVNEEASSKLDEARKYLKDLMNKHPDSPAAQSAKRMLDADQAMPEATILPLTPLDSLQPTSY